MKNLDDVLSGLPADRRQRIELRVKEILAEETASFAKPLAAAVLLKKAVNDSADECGPDCDDYAHGESCPACDPAKWLVDQQVEIERLRQRVAYLEEEMPKRLRQQGEAWAADAKRKDAHLAAAKALLREESHEQHRFTQMTEYPSVTRMLLWHMDRKRRIDAFLTADSATARDE